MPVEKFPLSSLVNVLESLGVPRSSIYNWASTGAIAGAEVVEEKGQKQVYIKDKEKFKNWIADKLGLKGVKIIEKVEQGIPFSKYEELVEEVRRLEKKAVEKEAENLIIRKEKEELFKKFNELQRTFEETKNLLEMCREELKEREQKIRELSKRLMIEELEPVIRELSEENRKLLLEILNKV